MLTGATIVNENLPYFEVCRSVKHRTRPLCGGSISVKQNKHGCIWYTGFYFYRALEFI